MEHYQALGLEGGLIRVYGEVVAFTIGDRLSADTYDVHFEKAYGELQGAYAMINREFARWVRARHRRSGTSTGRTTWAWRACAKPSRAITPT